MGGSQGASLDPINLCSKYATKIQQKNDKMQLLPKIMLIAALHGVTLPPDDYWNKMRVRKPLHLSIPRQWYEMIESGEKCEAYCATTPYWTNRLRDKALTCADKVCNGCDCELSCFLTECGFEQFDTVKFRMGCTGRTMTFEIESITIGFGKPEWGAPQDREVYIIKLGKRIAY